jgi:hypothetical protein
MAFSRFEVLDLVSIPLLTSALGISDYAVV